MVVHCLSVVKKINFTCKFVVMIFLKVELMYIPKPDCQIRIFVFNDDNDILCFYNSISTGEVFVFNYFDC